MRAPPLWRLKSLVRLNSGPAARAQARRVRMQLRITVRAAFIHRDALNPPWAGERTVRRRLRSQSLLFTVFRPSTVCLSEVCMRVCACVRVACKRACRWGQRTALNCGPGSARGRASVCVFARARARGQTHSRTQAAGSEDGPVADPVVGGPLLAPDRVAPPVQARLVQPPPSDAPWVPASWLHAPPRAPLPPHQGHDSGWVDWCWGGHRRGQGGRGEADRGPAGVVGVEARL
jgi:hypothetical protein